MDRDRGVITKELSLRWLRHQPHCRSCLAHDNSYLFPAWYDLSRESVERLARVYEENYPDRTEQPLFFANGDRAMTIRLPRTHDVHNESDGDIDMETLRAEFNICTHWPEERTPLDQSRWETHEFDLSTPEGWAAMLKKLPQKERKPEAPR